MEYLRRNDDKQFSTQESVEFLIAEYNQSSENLRHYSKIQNSIVSFSLTGYITLLAAIYAIYQFDSQSYMKYVFLILILLLSFIAGCIILMFFIRNRMYFTVVAKQVNSLRNYFLSNSELDFINYNKSYFSHDRPRNYNPLSIDFMYIYVVSLLNSSLVSIGFALFLHYIFYIRTDISIIFAVIVYILSEITQIYLVIKHLKDKDMSNSDNAIWGRK